MQTPSTIRSRSSFSDPTPQTEILPEQTDGLQNLANNANKSALLEAAAHRSSGNGESRVMEEDDLESIISDRESLCQVN